MNKFLILFSLTIASPAAFGYLGPGMAGGTIAAVLGFFAAIFLGLLGRRYDPMNRAWKNYQASKQHEKGSEDIE